MGYLLYDMGSHRAIYNDIAARTSVFFRPWQKNSLGQGRALGPALGNFLASEEKNLCFGAISLYIALRDPIYTLHIYIIPMKHFVINGAAADFPFFLVSFVSGRKN